MSEPEKIYTIADIAKMFGMSEKTVRKWIKKGELRAMDMGREFRISQSALNDFIQLKESKGALPETKDK